MVQTFDTSRVGGGTYELELDSTGNYKLKSVGFEAVDKLNLPDLKTSDTSVADTTKKATEDTIKAQTTEVFKPMNTYGDRGGEGNQSNTSTPMLKTAKVNEPTVRNAGDPMTKIDTGKTDSKFLASGAAGGASLQSQTVDPITGAGRSQSDKFKERFDPTKIQAATPQTTGLQKNKIKSFRCCR
jgi:hypothetical protein